MRVIAKTPKTREDHDSSVMVFLFLDRETVSFRLGTEPALVLGMSTNQPKQSELKANTSWALADGTVVRLVCDADSDPRSAVWVLFDADPDRDAFVMPTELFRI